MKIFKKILNKIKFFKKKMRYYHSVDYCYDQRRSEGKADKLGCSGLFGADLDYGYLQCTCCDCKYLCKS